MEFHQIRYFLMTAETLNFTRASERCNISQPALTRAIKKLEEELGGSLFRRERNRTHLTNLGHVMREHLNSVDVTIQDAVTAARKLISMDVAPLNVGVMCTVGSTRMIPFLSEFQQMYPGIELSLHDVTPMNMTEGLLSGDLDCSLLGLPMALHDRFDTTALYKERIVVIYPIGHKFRGMEDVPLQELVGENYLDRLKCEFRDSFLNLLKEKKIELTISYRSEREDWIQSMVAKGMGVTTVPEFSIISDDVEFRPIADPDLMRSVEIVTVAGYQRSPAVTAFVREATQYKWQQHA